MKTKLLCLIPILLTAACSPQVAPTPTVPAPPISPTRAAASPTARALSAPAVQQHFSLIDLPGAGRDPYAVAILGDRVYVANSTTDNVAVIQNNRAVKFIPVGKDPVALAADPAQNRLYVSNASDKTISLITNDQVTLTQSVGAAARTLLFFENRLFVGLDTQDGILVLDPATLQTQTRISIPNIFTVIRLAGDAVHHRLYANLYEKTAVIDSTTLRVSTILPIKDSYETLVANPQNDSVLLSIYESSSRLQWLVAFDPISGSERSRAKIGGDPRGAVVKADGSRVYVANSYTNDVTVIDPRAMSVVATIPVGLAPNALALDEGAHRLHIANADSDNLSVVNTDTNQVVAAVPLAMIPTALLANENAGRVYVANASTDSVFVVEGARVVKEIPVGHHPIDLSRDEKSNRLFVANAADSTLTIVDETSFGVRATQPITQFVSTVAVDAPRTRIFVNDVVLDLNTLAPIARLIVHGNTIDSNIAPNSVRLNPGNNRIYAGGWNGTPGSNSRNVTYSVDGNTLQQRTMLAYYGNTTAIALDPESNRLYMAGTHPLAYTNGFTVFDANDQIVFSMSLPARTTGMVYNPQTHHLFLAHAESYSNQYSPKPAPADNIVQILDTSSFGEVARLDLDSPGKMTRLGNAIYVANSTDGSITLIQDVSVPTPPSPTPTVTPSPYPTLAPASATPSLPPVRTVAPTATVPLICKISTSTLAAQVWTPQIASRLSCPIETQRAAQFAVEPFERGTLFYRDDEKRIYALFADKTWAAFDDTWNASLPVDSCPSVTVGAGLIKPQRGFGKVWCDQASARAKIGAATATEHGLYSALTQRFERGQIFASELPSLVFVLYADGKWE
ncbi:MAG: YncE family protein [Chloroflexota bacterium]|nr:YncE family protein [Chloroflexota bacterium]